MEFLKHLFGGNKTNTIPTKKQTQPIDKEVLTKVSLKKDILVKELTRKNLENNIAEVVFVLDKSGSMRRLYKNGEVQNLLENIFPMAMCFDDNQVLDFYLFDDGFKKMPPVTKENLATYVKDEIIKKNIGYGGTSYAPIINNIIKKYGKNRKTDTPVFVVFITDGDCSDESMAEYSIKKASNYNIFWKFIGIGNSDFDFLKRLDKIKGRFVDNANFFSAKSLNAMPSEELYCKLIEEYDSWLEAYGAAIK